MKSEKSEPGTANAAREAERAHSADKTRREGVTGPTGYHTAAKFTPKKGK